MARVLIVGCGCRGRALAGALRADGHAVRGTTRSEAGLAAIEAAGAEGVVADPDRLGTLMGHLVGVTAVCWLLGSANGGNAAELHGPRLETLLERLVDTPVRGFVYEAAGSVDGGLLAGGAAAVRAAAERWRIPAEVVETDPADHDAWLAATRAAVERLLESA
jgi:nucleoside-diphosphate-sugar epimerase